MDEFLIRYPAFSQVAPDKINLALSDAAQEMKKKAWGKLYARGLCALAAYLLDINGVLSGGNDGGLSDDRIAASESVGSVSVSYLSPDLGFSDDHEGLALNRFGREYLRLRNLIRMHILAVR